MISDASLTSGQPFPSSLLWPTRLPPNLQSQNESVMSFLPGGMAYTQSVRLTLRKHLTKLDLDISMETGPDVLGAP